MDYDRLWTVADRARERGTLPSADAAFIRDIVPRELASVPRLKFPQTSRHPAGFTVTGAPVGTFARSALLIAGRKVLGGRYRGSTFYEDVEKDLAFGIMRSNFHHGYPAGTHCCVQCTLAVYPILALGAIRYFDCRALAKDARRLIEDGEWRFAKPANPAMVKWALASPVHSFLMPAR